MTDNIDVVIKETGADAVEKAFDRVGAAARRANTDVAALQKLFGSVGRSTAAATRVTALGTAAQGTAGHVANLSAAMGALNANRVTATLSSTNGALRGTGAAATTAAVGVRSLVSAFLGLQVIRTVVTSLIDAQIAMQQIHYGLLAATGSAEGANREFKYLEANAEKLGLNLKTSAMEYTRLAASASAMNVAVSDQQKLYTALSQASTVLHLDQQKVQFATLALTQMFSKGKIQAEELRRQLGEAIPGANVRFQKAVMEIVKGTDLAKYSFEQLMKKGLLNTAKFLPQLTQALTEVGRGWEEAATGMNAEINRLGTAWFKLKNDLSDGLFSDATVAIVRFLSSNMQSLAGIVAGLGLALAAAFAPAAIMQLIGYVKVLSDLLWATAGPWGLIAAGIIGVTGYLVTMRDEIKLSSDSAATLGDVFSVVLGDLKSTFGDFFGALPSMFGAVVTTFMESLSLWTTGNTQTIDYLRTKYSSYFSDLEQSNDSTWLKVLKGTARTIDAIVGMFVGLGLSVINVFAEMYKFISTVMSRTATMASSIVTGNFEAIPDLIKGNLQSLKDVFGNIGDAVGGSFDAAFGSVLKNGLEARINSVQKRADALRKDKLLAGLQFNSPPPAVPGDPTDPKGDDKGAAKRAKEIEKLQNALANLLGTIDPTQNALKELAKAQELLTKAVKSGDPEMAAMIEKLGGVDKIMGRLKDKYKEVLDPIGAMVDKYKEEREILSYVGDEQKIQAEVLGKLADLRKKNYDMTKLNVGLLWEEARATAAARKENELYNSILGDTLEKKQQDALLRIKAISDLKNSGKISSGEAGKQMVDMFGQDKMQGTQEYYDMQFEIYQNFLAKVEAARLAGDIKEKTAQSLMAQANIEYMEQRLQGTRNMFGALASLSTSSNRKLATIGKAAAVADAVITGILATQKALAAPPGPPYTFPMAAVTATMAAVNVAKIVSTPLPGFRTGGEFMVGGSGGQDSKTVAFNASPNETISIKTPQQLRDERNQERASNRPVRIGNTFNIMVPPTTDYRSGSQISQYAAEGVSSGERNT